MLFLEKLPSRLQIGRVGENDYCHFEFDCTAWLDAYPDGQILAVYNRPDGQTYPVTLSRRDNIVGWAPKAVDMIKSGYGRLELQIRSGAVIGKSAWINVYVTEALQPGQTPTPPPEDWLEQILAAAATATSKAQEAAESKAATDIAREQWETMSAEAETLDPSDDATASYADGVLHLGIPRGRGGEASWNDIDGKPFDSIGDNLKVIGRVLTVDTASSAQQDNTRPITSAAVYTEVGNINALLALI